MDRLEIEEILNGYSIPYMECGPNSFEIAGKIKQKKIEPFAGKRYPEKDVLLSVICDTLRKNGLVIIWLHTGVVGVVDMYHSYFLYDVDPINGFSVFHDHLGPKFYDEEQILSAIDNTMEKVRSDGGVEIHIIF